MSDILKQPDIPRRQLAACSEYYDDAWKIDAYLAGRTMAAQGTNLLQAKLKEREEFREKQLAYIATKRGVDPKVLRDAILNGQAPALSEEEKVEE